MKRQVVSGTWAASVPAASSAFSAHDPVDRRHNRRRVACRLAGLKQALEVCRVETLMPQHIRRHPSGRSQAARGAL